MAILKDLAEIIGRWFTSRTASDTKIVWDIYRETISDLKKDLDEHKKIIEAHRKKHPGNGIELDEWLLREEKLNQQLIKMVNENRDLKEMIIMLNIQIKQFEKLVIKLNNQNKQP